MSFLRVGFRLFFAPFFAAIGLTACTDVEDVQRAVSEASREVGAHYSIISASASLTEAHDELERHADSIDSDMRRIRSRLDDLDATCDTDRNGVWGTVFDLDARIDVYLAGAGGTSDVGALRSLCTEYRADMDALFDSLHQSIGDLPCW